MPFFVFIQYLTSRIQLELASRIFALLTIDVLGLKVDDFVVDVLKVDVLEAVHMGRPVHKHTKITKIEVAECGTEK